MTLPVICEIVNNPQTLSEKFAVIGEMMLRGMGTVFFVLVILWAVIAVFGAVAKAEEKREQKRIMEQVKNSPAPNDRETPAAPVPEVPGSDENEEPIEDDGALIAVITAAVEAYRAAEGLPATSYRVVSFRRKKSGQGWTGASAE